MAKKLIINADDTLFILTTEKMMSFGGGVPESKSVIYRSLEEAQKEMNAQTDKWMSMKSHSMWQFLGQRGERNIMVYHQKKMSTCGCKYIKWRIEEAKFGC